MTIRLICAIQIEPFFMSIDRLCQALDGFGVDVELFSEFIKAGKKCISCKGARKDNGKLVDFRIKLLMISVICTIERYAEERLEAEVAHGFSPE